MNELADRLREDLTEKGADLVGFADMSHVPEKVRPPLPVALVFGIVLDARVIDGIRTGPTREYYDLYKHTNARLDAMAQHVSSMLIEAGFQAIPVLSTIPGAESFDKATLSTKFSHKMAATRAGLGWIGKCALLVTPQYGSAVRFATVLTDADLPVGVPITESRCGECSNCVAVCPGEAPSGKNWDVAMYRDDFFNAFACLNGILQHQSDFGFVCGMCIPACPWTQKYMAPLLSSS